MSELLFEKRPDGVALITLNRPESLNALTPAIYEGMSAALIECEDDNAVRCIALTGAGRAFCAGGDVKAMAVVSARAGKGTSIIAGLDRSARELRDLHYITSLKLHTIPKPVVAIVNGHAMGAGMSMALACDLRLCSDRARFSTAFRNVGLSGDFGMSFYLPRVVGGGRARELFFTAEMLDAARALELGIANQVHPYEELMERALEFCASLAAGPTAAYARMKANLNLAETADLKSVLDQEAFNQRLLRLSADHREATQAFVEKRPPAFTGE